MARWLFSTVLLSLALTHTASAQVIDLDDGERGPRTGIRLDDEATPTPGQMTEEASQIKRHFDGNKWLEASLGLDRVYRGETGDDRGNRQIAQYQLAIALYNQRFYTASLGIFRAIADDLDHNKHKETALWLARLSIQLPEPAGIVELAVRYHDPDLEHFANPQQKDLYWQLGHLLGRAEYKAGALERAVKSFQAVGERSPFFPPAKMWEGAARVQLGQAAPAIRAFEQARDSLAGEDDEDARRTTALAELAIARVFYSSAIHGQGPADASVDARRLSAALLHYDRVAPGEHRQDALVESAWARYMAGDFSRSMGALTASKAPQFGALPRLDADRLEVLLAYATCQYESATTLIATSRATREPARKAIADRLQKLRDDQPGSFVAWAQKSNVDGAAGPLTALTSTRRVRRHLEYLSMIEQEQARLKNGPASLRESELGAYITEELDLQRAIATATADELLRTDLEALAKEYRNHDAALTKMADAIATKKPGAARAPGQLAGVFRPARDPDAIQWPFDGEYWKDEADSYQAVVVSRCK
jgi:hypothetical protein